MEPLIKISNLRIIYNQGKDNEFKALDEINVEIFPEEYIIFFGPSGCGKSTLLYTMLGLQTPSEGKVVLNGRDSALFTEAEKSDICSKFFGIIFQSFNLIYSLNVVDNVILPRVFLGAAHKERQEKAAGLLSRFGLETRIKSLPSNLSGGQQQRVAICRALVNDPVVLLADEPVGNLDSESASVVMETLKDINVKDKKTVILVTHDASYLPYADRVFYFKNGKIERVEKNEKKRVAVAHPGEAAPEPAQTPMQTLEKMAHVRTSLTVPQMKAWSLTNYLLDELTLSQTERLDHAMENLLNGKIGEYEFYEELDKPFHEGGVGLYRSTAYKYADRVSNILRQVRDCAEELDKNNPADIRQKRKVVQMIYQFLLSDYGRALNEEQLWRLREAIATRVYKNIPDKEFTRMLSGSPEDGGVGLKPLAAERLMEKVAVILTQQV